MKILITADWHIKGERPICRLDENWIESQRETIAAIREVYEKTGCEQMWILGDLFDAPERRLKHALWRAIALFCARSCEYFNGIMSHCLMGQDDLYKRCEEKKNKYLHAMYKCRAKAEECK